MTKTLSLFFLIFFITACYEAEEGCLDRKATDFEIGADEPCSDCCTYPKLKIRFDNKWQFPDTLAAFSTDSVFHDELNQPFRINRIRFYWSNYRLEVESGEQLFVTDLIEIKIPNGADSMVFNVIDHYLLADVNSSTDNLTLGTIVPKGVVTGMSVDFGIDRPTNSAAPSAMPDNHVLLPQLGDLNYGSDIGYVFAQIEYFQDTTEIDTIPVIINIFGDDALRSLSLSLDISALLIEGFNPQLVIETNFAQWFDGVNVRLGDTTAIQSQIVDNIAGSFTLKEVLAN